MTLPLTDRAALPLTARVYSHAHSLPLTPRVSASHCCSADALSGSRYVRLQVPLRTDLRVQCDGICAPDRPVRLQVSENYN